MTRRLAIAVWLLAVPAPLVAQTPPPDPAPADTTPAPPVPSPALLEVLLGPAALSGGGAARPGLALFIGAGWFGRDGTGGWRVGLTGSGAEIGGPWPSDVGQGLVRTRNTTAITAERVRRWHRPGRAMTLGIGVGAGNQNADLARDRARPEARQAVNGWAPAVSAAADVAYTVPATARGVLVAPLDLTVGVRVTSLLGAPRVGDLVPASGSVAAPRGVATMVLLTVGVRFGVFGELFGIF
jgi:hypothetical protein